MFPLDTDHLGFMTLPRDIARQLRREAVGTLVEPYIDRIIELARPAIRVNLRPYEQQSGTANRLGGVPDVPNDWKWPKAIDGHLRFLAQVNLYDLAPFRGAELLPKSGLLSFFYGPKLVAASNASEQDVARVFHFETDSLARAKVPNHAAAPLTPFSLTFKQIWSLPEDKWNLAAKDLYADIPEHEHEAFVCELVEIGDAPGAMMLFGYPSREQAGFLEYQCEAHRVGDDSASRDGSTERIEEAARQWQLLAQFDLSWKQVWPDGNDGCLHFWIRRSDIAKSDFLQICFTWERT